MKRIGLILSLVLFSSSCAGFPKKNLFIVDLANKVCAEYEIIDECNMKFRWLRDLPLAPKGPCDRMAGWRRQDFKDIQNWIRKECTNNGTL